MPFLQGGTLATLLQRQQPRRLLLLRRQQKRLLRKPRRKRKMPNNGRRKPKSGSVFHMYGVDGFDPNLSVKKFQNSVAES